MNHPAGPNQFVFEDRPEPLLETELRIEGTLPGCVRGRLLCNGTGQLKLGGEQLREKTLAFCSAGCSTRASTEPPWSCSTRRLWSAGPWPKLTTPIFWGSSRT